MPFHRFFDPISFGVEFVYTSVILVLCFLIYFKTKEMYDLSKHKGIEYFRNAFLFLGFAYLVRFVLHLLLISRMSLDIFVPMRYLQMPLLALTGYFSTMAIFFLLYSMVWKRIKVQHFLTISNVVAVLFSVVAFVARSHIILIALQMVLLISAVMLSFLKHSKSKKSLRLRTLYMLLLVFWLFNMYLIGPRRLFSFEIKILFNAIALVVFSIIYWKVSKWAK